MSAGRCPYARAVFAHIEGLDVNCAAKRSGFFVITAFIRVRTMFLLNVGEMVFLLPSIFKKPIHRSLLFRFVVLLPILAKMTSLNSI